MIVDEPLLVRGSSDLILFTISTLYILHNRAKMQKNDYIMKSEKDQVMEVDMVL